MLAATVSCLKQEYVTESFVTLANDTYTVDEDTVALKIPVFNSNKIATAVTFKVKDNTAKAGEFFNLQNKTGVINFADGQQTDTIVVDIINQAGKFTGTTDFSISIESATNGVSVCGASECKITIKDLDHPLSSFFGKYEMKSVSVNTNGSTGYFTWEMEMAADPKSSDNVVCDYMCYFAWSYEVAKGLIGTVSADKKTITFTLPQITTSSADDMFTGGGMGYFGYYGWEGDMNTGAPVTGKYDVVFTLQDDGSYMTKNPFHLNSTGYVVKADWLYYLMNNVANFNASYPTYFKKK